MIPIEDLPESTMENYEYNYRGRLRRRPCIRISGIMRICCPWPHGVFDGRKYPRFQPNIAKRRMRPATRRISPGRFPGSYSPCFPGMFQLFGDMEQKRTIFPKARERFCGRGYVCRTAACSEDLPGRHCKRLESWEIRLPWQKHKIRESRWMKKRRRH